MWALAKMDGFRSRNLPKRFLRCLMRSKVPKVEARRATPRMKKKTPPTEAKSKPKTGALWIWQTRTRSERLDHDVYARLEPIDLLDDEPDDPPRF